MYEEWGIDEGGWGRGNGIGMDYVWGGWSIIKYEISGMKPVEHNTTIGHNFINEYGTEYFKSV